MNQIQWNGDLLSPCEQQTVCRLSISLCVDSEWGRYRDSDPQQGPHWQNQQHLEVQTPNSWWGELPHWFLVAILWVQRPPPLTSRRRILPSLSPSLHFSERSSQMISRTSQGTKPLFFPLATLMKPLRSPSLLTQIWGEMWKQLTAEHTADKWSRKSRPNISIYRWWVCWKSMNVSLLAQDKNILRN